VEVLSSDRNHDLVTKRQRYEAGGIPEYWIIDAVADTLTVLELADGVYSERAVLTAEDTLTTPLFPDFDLPLAQLFNHPARIRR
jgi:Uma2 family endonuclease